MYLYTGGYCTILYTGAHCILCYVPLYCTTPYRVLCILYYMVWYLYYSTTPTHRYMYPYPPTYRYCAIYHPVHCSIQGIYGHVPGYTRVYWGTVGQYHYIQGCVPYGVVLQWYTTVVHVVQYTSVLVHMVHCMQ